MGDIQEQEMAYRAMDSAFLLLTGRATIKELFDNNAEELFIPFLPGDVIDRDTMIQELIEHYAYLEEYDKCIELRDIDKCQ